MCFNIFGNLTKLELSGHSTADFGSFVPKSANWGAAFGYKRISMNARWNYQGLTRVSPRAEFGPEGAQYVKARTTLDYNAAYQLFRRFSVNLSINNVRNAPTFFMRYGPQTPNYARVFQRREFGARVAIGLKGSF